MLLGALAYALIVVVALAALYGTGIPRSWFGIAGVLPLSIVAAAFGWRAAREPGLGERMRRAWLILAAAHLCYGMSMAFGGYRLSLSDQPPGIAASVLSLLFYPLLVWALLSFPAESSTPQKRRVFWLDTATALLAGALVFWYVVPPLAATDGPLANRLVLIGAAIGDYVLLLGMVAILFRRSLPRLIVPVRLLALSIVILWVAQVSDALAQVQRIESGSWPVVLRIAQLLLVVASAYAMMRWTGKRGVKRSPGKRKRDRRFAVPLPSLPYVGITLGFGAVLHAADAAAPPEQRVLVAVGGLLIALMVIRQSVVIRDTEQARDTLRASEERFRALVQHASDLVTVVDPNGIVSYQGASAERVLGRAPLEPGTALDSELHPDDRKILRETLSHSLRAPRTPVRGEWRARHSNGGWLHLETFATNLIGDGVIDGIVLNSSDITERKTLEDELTHRAFHDSLTGLANRALFSNILDLALIRGRRSGKGIAVLFVDLDSFKQVNDVLGHSAGDSVLIEVAERLKREVRVSDTVARLGGDEFAILLDEMTLRDHAMPVTRRILAGLQISVPTGTGDEITVTPSIGLAVATGVESREEMLRMADTAMYEAKRAGGNRCLDYGEVSGSSGALQALEEADLRRAIELGEFALRYQPIQALENGRITAVSAEVRWFHPRQGLLPPEEFIPLADATGLDLLLGYHVIEEACRQVGVWQRRFSSNCELGLNLGVTIRQLQDPAFSENLRGILSRAGLPARSLVIEITEADLVKRKQSLSRSLLPVRELGVRVAVIEFGAGCRILNSLADFPLDVLRLHPSIVADLSDGGRPAAGAILSLGHMLNLQTHADGVQAALELDVLKNLGCELAQGQHVGQPVSRDQLEDLLRNDGSHRLFAAS